MKGQFFDKQDTANPLNGHTLEDPQALRAIIRQLQERPPFIAELIGKDHKLTLGLGASALGCVQFSPSDGDPPYWVAVSDEAEAEGEVEFLIGNTITPIPRRLCIPMDKVIDIAATFLQTGERLSSVHWEEI